MQSGGEKSTRKHALTATVIIAIAAVMIFAGVAYAKQTTSSTTQRSCPRTADNTRDGPFSGETPPYVREGRGPARVQNVVQAAAAGDSEVHCGRNRQHTFKEWFAQVPQDLKDKMPQDLRDTLNERLSRVA